MYFVDKKQNTHKNQGRGQYANGTAVEKIDHCCSISGDAQSQS
jgi:hypothetical protein